jgi:hypothetical protein
MSELRQGHALIIGIDAYSGGISPLQSAVADAAAIAQLLSSQHDYVTEQLLDADAGQANIKACLEKLSETLDEESAFLLYFAGHGAARGDGSEGPQGYLLPQDARPSDVDSWLSMEWLRATLDALPCKHLLVVLDCCFAGSFRWASTRALQWVGEPLYDSQFERYLQGTAWQALTSASADQRALDVTPGASNTRGDAASDGHSPFAAALMRGLSGAADSSRGGHEPDGVMTATELFQYTFEELVPAGNASHQTPGIWPLKPDNQGQYIFRNPQAARKTIPDPPLDDRNNPWLGLKSYTGEHQRLFFGRERVVLELLERLATGPGLLAILGASGTGKSSVVKAGLIPRLQHPQENDPDQPAGWGVVEMGRLGENPGHQLDTALLALAEIDAGDRRLLLIDQFEELYTQTRNATRRDNFLDRLRLLIDDDRTTVMITLRSDFEPRPAASKALRDLWSKDETRYLVPAFSIEEYRDCIEGPALVKALYFEPASLVDELLDEVAAMPGALPMLSFALAEMYRSAQSRRQTTGANDRALTHEDYKAIGGMVGAMHRRATILYEDLDEASRDSVKRVFLRMLSSEGGRVARRRVKRQELEWTDPEENQRIDRILQQYIDARLLVADGEDVEPAHDTLVAAWDLLLNWRQQALPQELLRTAWRDASDWANSEQDKGLLWDNNPERLTQAESRIGELNRLETGFIVAGRQFFKQRRRTRWTTGFVVGAVIVATAVFAFMKFTDAYWQADERLDALMARDKLFLDFHAQQPHLFTPDNILPGAPWNVLEPIAAIGPFGPFKPLKPLDPEQPLEPLKPLELPESPEPVDELWKVVIGDSRGALAMARNYTPFDADEYDMEAARILALGHDGVLKPVEGLSLQDGVLEHGPPMLERFLKHSLSWLETDAYSPIYISVGHGESLENLPTNIEPLDEIPDMPACEVEDEPFILELLREPGIRQSAGPDDPLFADVALHNYLQSLGYCTIFFVSKLEVLLSDVPEGVLIVADAWNLNEQDMNVIEEWVDSNNGLLVAGSGAKWVEANGGHVSDYPMNQVMRRFGMQWTDHDNN